LAAEVAVQVVRDKMDTKERVQVGRVLIGTEPFTQWVEMETDISMPPHHHQIVVAGATQGAKMAGILTGLPVL
jgi:hypothetical protein